MASTRRKRMANRSQQPVQVNGLYVHASPPRVVQMNPSIMRQWLRGGDLDKLEQVVLEGQGSRLVGEYSADPKTRAFIRSVPSLLSKIEAAHAATSRGQLKELQDLIAGEKRIQLALAKDRSGVGLLHKAVFQDHGNITEWLIQAYPATVNSKDREGRSPLHYCGAGSDAQYTWRILIEAGADPQQADVRGRVPAYYMDNPDDLRLPASPADSEEIRRITAAREGLIVKPSNIRIWIHDQDLGRLKQVLWEGHGNRLKTETSKYPAVKRFLDFIPYAMNAIRDTHAAAISGDREAFQNRTAEPAPVDLILSKDSNGLTPLHKSAGLGNVGVTEEILRRAPRATVVTDNFGRTPLHYSVLVKDQGEMYNMLIREGADELAVDNLGRTAEYYRNRPGDLDPSLLRNIPEAPRTSSIFPPSWDWNVLASDGSISNQTSGASRRPRKTPRTSGAARSEGGGSPLDEVPSTNGPVNGQAGTDEDRPKTSESNVVTSADTQLSDNAQNSTAGDGRLDSQTSSAADGVLDEQHDIMSELFPEIRTFLRRLSDLGEIYKRAGLNTERSADVKINGSNSDDNSLRFRNLSEARRVTDGNGLRVPDIRIDSPIGTVKGEEIESRIGLDEDRKDFSLDDGNPGRINDKIVTERTITKEDKRLSNDINTDIVDDREEASFEIENSVTRPGIFGANGKEETDTQLKISDSYNEGAIRESDRQNVISKARELDRLHRVVPRELGQTGILENATQFSDQVNSKENGDNDEQTNTEGRTMNTDIVSGLSSDQSGVLDAEGMKPNSMEELLSSDRGIQSDIQSMSRSECNDVDGSIRKDPTEIRTTEAPLQIKPTEGFKNETLLSREAMVQGGRDGKLTRAEPSEKLFQKMYDVNADEQNTENRRGLSDLVGEAVISRSEKALEPEGKRGTPINLGDKRVGNVQDASTELAVSESDGSDRVFSVMDKAEEGRGERDNENQNFQSDIQRSVINQELFTSRLDATVSDNEQELSNDRMEQPIRKTQDIKEVGNSCIHGSVDVSRAILHPPVEQGGVTNRTTDLTNIASEFPEGETSLDGKSITQRSRDLIQSHQAQENNSTLSEKTVSTDFDLTQVIPSLSSPSLEQDTDKGPFEKSLPEAARPLTNLSNTSTNQLQTNEESTGGVQEGRLTAIKDDEVMNSLTLGTQNESFGLVDGSIGDNQCNNDTLAADSTLEVDESMKNYVDLEGVTRTLRQTVDAGSDINQSANDKVSKSLESNGGSGQDRQNISQKVRNSIEYNSLAVNVQEERDGSTANSPASTDFSDEQSLGSLAKNGPSETASGQTENFEMGSGIGLLSGRKSGSKVPSFTMTNVQTSQLQSAVEETAGRIEEDSKEKTDDGKTPNEPPQTDDGNGVPASGLPDETPIRSQSQVDGEKPDDNVLPASTDTGEPTNNIDGADNGSGEAEQSAESNDLADRPKSANEKQETAPENVKSEEGPGVKDQPSEEVEKRDKRSVEDKAIDEIANTVNVANGVPSTDEIPSVKDTTADVDVRKPDDSSPPLDIQGIQEILTNQISTNDVPTTDSIPTTDDIPAAVLTNAVPTIDSKPTTDDIPAEISTNGVPTIDSKPTTDDIPAEISINGVPTIDSKPTTDDIPAEISTNGVPATASKPTTDDIPAAILTNDVPTTDSVPTSDDIPAAGGGDLPEKIDGISEDVKDAIKSNVSLEDTNLPSANDVLDIPSYVVDAGSADENQDDAPGEQDSSAGVSQPDAKVKDTKIPNGDVTRDAEKDVKDPPDSPKEAAEETAEGTSNAVARQNIADGSNTVEDEPDTAKSMDDNKDDSENNNGDSRDVGNEIDANKNVNESKEDMNEDPKGDGDDNNNDIEEQDKEAPGTPDSIDVVSGDRSADENEEEDTSDRAKVEDQQCGGNDGEPSMGDDTARSSGMGVENGPQSTAEENSGDVEPTDKTQNRLETIAEGNSNEVADSEGNSGPSDAAKEKVPEAEASPREVAGTGASFRAATAAVSSGVAPPEEGSSEVDTEGGASNADEAPHQDDTEDTNEVSNGLSEEERKLEDGDSVKEEGLSNATTAIIGAQSSPDTINTDDFQESDSRLYRSSRRPQTPLPAPSTVLTEEDEDEGVIGDEEEEQSRRGLVNGDGARHVQGRVIGERNMDNQAAVLNIGNGGAAGQGTTSGPPKPDPEVERLIARGDLSALAELVLNGEGHRLVGRRSEMPELQSFIENVPTYMAKIQNVHDSARSGQLRELQASLDRRKFAVARDPRTAAGATPLHAAVLLGQTAVVRYLAGRFPETLAARDARGRAPLHCAAVLPDNGHYFNLLLNLGADRSLKDNSGRTASYYMQNPGVLTHKQLLADINAPQSIADESFADKVPDDKVTSRRCVVNDPELTSTMDKYFQIIEEAAADARADNRTVCRMVVLKFLTRNVFDQCKYILTRMDHGILNVIWPVILDQSRSVEDRLKQSGTFFEEAGIVLPDYESYSVFSVIVLPVIKYLNGLDPKQPILPHPSSQFFEDAEEDVSSSGTTVSVLSRMELRNDEAAQRSMDLDPSRKMILHSVAHCTRNLEDFNLPQSLTLDELRQVERYLRRALLTGRSPYETKESGHELDDLVLSDDEGTYYPLEELSDPLHDVRVKLRSAGQWLEQQGDPDRLLRLHGKYWPLCRGVFVTKDGSIAAYINVQDHLRVMVASKEGQAGKIGLVYRTVGEFMEKVDNIFKFKKDDILGFLAARPWVCGNTLRFKVTVRLPKLGREPEHLVALCKTRSLRLASAASLDVFHFSNRQCLGITEAQVYRSFVTAVANILQLEHRMEANGLHFTAILGKIFRKRHVEANAVR